MSRFWMIVKILVSYSTLPPEIPDQLWPIWEVVLLAAPVIKLGWEHHRSKMVDSSASHVTDYWSVIESHWIPLDPIKFHKFPINPSNIPLNPVKSHEYPIKLHESLSYRGNWHSGRGCRRFIDHHHIVLSSFKHWTLAPELGKNETRINYERSAATKTCKHSEKNI